jgi:hypothetical protein
MESSNNFKVEDPNQIGINTNISSKKTLYRQITNVYTHVTNRNNYADDKICANNKRNKFVLGDIEYDPLTTDWEIMTEEQHKMYTEKYNWLHKNIRENEE